jgi:hypothetical protein
VRRSVFLGFASIAAGRRRILPFPSTDTLPAAVLFRKLPSFFLPLAFLSIAADGRTSTSPRCTG